MITLALNSVTSYGFVVLYRELALLVVRDAIVWNEGATIRNAWLWFLIRIIF
jgi:hypothetical protein